MNERDGGKGDSPRPFSVDLEKFAENFDLIFGKKEKQDGDKTETDKETND